ncbi:MAG: Ig-like domain-containing protein, partial [Acidimicrobiia bacterium]
MRRLSVRVRAAVVAVVAVLAHGFVVLAAAPALGSVADCSAANARTWVGPASGSWGTGANWSGGVVPGANEIACIASAAVSVNVNAEVDAVVSGGRLSGTGFTLTLSPQAGEESSISELIVGPLALDGPGNIVVTETFSWGAGPLGGAAGSTLTLAPTVSAATISGGFGGTFTRSLVVSSGVTVNQSTTLNGIGAASVVNSGVWSLAGTATLTFAATPGFVSTATGVVRHSGAGVSNFGPFSNAGRVEVAEGELRFANQGTSTGVIDIAAGATARFPVGTFDLAGTVTGEGTLVVGDSVRFTGVYSVAHTELTVVATAVFDTPSPQLLRHLVLGGGLGGSAAVRVTESFSAGSAARLLGTATLTIGASVGAATVAGGFLAGRDFVIEAGVTITQTGVINASGAGGSIINSGTWTIPNDSTIFWQAPGAFVNTATGVVRKSGGTGTSQISAFGANDGLITNDAPGTLALGQFGFTSFPGGITIGGSPAFPTLSGTGTLAPRVAQIDSLVAPGGTTPGILTTPGTWELRPNAALGLDIAGIAGFDKLTAGGGLSIASNTQLRLTTAPTYGPTPGDTFSIVEAPSITGTFATVTGTNLGNGLAYQVTYEPTRILLTVVGTALVDAVEDTITVPEDSPAVTIDVVANDTSTGGPLTATLAVGAVHGTAACTATTCTYTPAPDFNGTDAFAYRAADSLNNSDTATVTVTVTPVNDPPVAVDDTVSVVGDTVANVITPLINDSDIDNTITVTAVTPPIHGTVAINPDSATLTYTPAAGYRGPDSFTYTITDAAGATATATVTVAVTVPNVGAIEVVLDAQPDAPQDFVFTITSSVGGPLTFTLDDDGDPAKPARRTFASLVPGSYTIAPAAPVAGWTFGEITCSEAPAAMAGSTVTLQVDADDALRCTFVAATHAPVAVGDAATVVGDSTANPIDVLGNDSDLDGDALAVIAVDAPRSGTVTIEPEGGFVRYTPVAGFVGLDAFTYTVSDGHGGQATARVNVTVTQPNRPPVAERDNATTVRNTALVIDVLANDSDPDGDVLTIGSVTAPSHGSTAVVDGSVVYTPATGFEGGDFFAYVVVDGRGGTATTEVAITVRPPRGSITVVLDVPAGTQPVDFTLYGADLPVAFTLGGTDPVTRTFTNLPADPRSYTVSMHPAAPLTLDGSECSVPDDDVPDHPSFVLHDGEHVTCTFRLHRPVGSITVVLDVPAGTQPVDFTIYGADLPVAFTLGGTDPVTRTFTGLPADPRLYTVFVDLAAPLTLDGSGCSVPDDDVPGRPSFVLHDGEHVTCTFRLHRPVGSITVVLDVIDVPGGIPVGFVVYGTPMPVAFTMGGT